MTKKLLLKVVFPLFFALFSYLYLDRFIALHIHASTTFYPYVKWASKLIAPWFLLVSSCLLWTLSCFNAKWNHLRKPAFLFFTTTGITMFVLGNLKLLLRRPRPYQFIEDGIYGFFQGGLSKGYASMESYLSMPSSHAAVLVACSTLLCYMFPKAKPYAIAAAPLFLLTRILLRQHYLSDLLIGGVIGYVVAVSIYKCYPVLFDWGVSKWQQITTSLNTLEKK